MATTPHVLAIVGHKKSGKTTLVCQLVRYLQSWGLAVATLKHSSNPHPLDRAGSDSQAHLQAGAHVAAFLTPQGAAFFWPSTDWQAKLRLLEGLLTEVELLLVEGAHQRPFPKVEIFRAQLQRQPLCAHDSSCRAAISDCPHLFQVPVFALDDVMGLARQIQTWQRQHDLPSLTEVLAR